MRYAKMVFQWLIALGIGFCVVNLLCFGYERPVGWIDTPDGPSPSAWNPGAVLVHGTEGYGITRVDKNGYLNPDGVLQPEHILCMGSSHTQGKEVASDKKYTALLNAHFSAGNGQLGAYNIASDGNFLPSLIRHFPVAAAAFPDAAIMTLEISSVDFTPEQLEAALQQAEPPEGGSVLPQAVPAGLKEMLKTWIKEYFPLLRLLVTKLETAEEQNKTAAEVPTDNSRYVPVLEQALALLRSEFDGEILFVYHPATSIAPDGTLSCSYSANWEVFQRICREQNIGVVDLGPDFLECYETDRLLPYGFANTAPGSGHLNETGHRLMAEALIERIEEITQ